MAEVILLTSYLHLIENKTGKQKMQSDLQSATEKNLAVMVMFLYFFQQNFYTHGCFFPGFQISLVP